MRKGILAYFLGIILKLLCFRWRLHLFQCRIPRSPKKRYLQSVLLCLRPIRMNDIGRAYRSLLLLGLENGLSYQDLHFMRRTDNYFTIPWEGSQRLYILQRRFSFLSIFSNWITIDHLFVHQRLRTELNRILEKPADYWHPAYFRNQRDQVMDGLAPRNSKAGRFEIIVYVIPSPLGICWRSPRKLLGAVLNYLIPGKWHYIGHLAVELRRDNRTEALTGMTGDTNVRVMREFMLGKVGLGWFFNTFRGRLERASEMATDLTMHARHRRLVYIRSSVSEDAYNNVDSFLKAWWEQGLFQKYGLWQRPELQEGAGCASFAVAFLKELNIDQKRWMNSWIKTIRIPSAWIGGGKTGSKVSCVKLAWSMAVSSRSRYWSKRSQEVYFPLRFFDPDAIYRWITRLHEQRHAPMGSYSIYSESFSTAKGLRVERSYS